MQKIILITILIFLVASCKKESTTSVDSKTELKILSIQPTIGKAGDVVVINGAGFDSTFWRNVIRFNSVDARIDSGSEDRLYTRVPLYGTTGSISVVLYKEINQELVPVDSSFSQVFTVIPFGENNINIIQYDGPVLTESQSTVTNCMNINVAWSISENKDTIILSQGICVGDDTYVTRIIRFYNQTGDSLPRSAIGILKRKEISYVVIDTLKGYIALQDWKLKNIISGRATMYDTRFHDWWGFTFWFKY